MTWLFARYERAIRISRRSGFRVSAPDQVPVVSAAEQVPVVVGQQLGEFRRELCRGRGPGIGKDERISHTRNRPAVGGVPPVVSREQNHLQTLQARGEHSSARLEADWAATQFPQLAPGYRQVARPRSGSRRSGRAPALLAVLVLAWLRSRRRPWPGDNGLPAPAIPRRRRRALRHATTRGRTSMQQGPAGPRHAASGGPGSQRRAD